MGAGVAGAPIGGGVGGGVAATAALRVPGKPAKRMVARAAPAAEAVRMEEDVTKGALGAAEAAPFDTLGIMQGL